MAPKKSIAEDASSMAQKIREISISEFFSKNRHLLGFDNPVKSLLTAVREAVDNALDACEEAHILPDLDISITEVDENRYIVAVEDNGPGIVKTHLPNIFGKLLYGSKFHRLKQSRGQQGIGISAAVMYGQMTTGKPAQVISKTARGKIHEIQLQIDTKKNTPKVISDKVLTDKSWSEKESGTKISIELTGAYKESKQGILAYIRQSALSNSHAQIRFKDPKGAVHDFPRLVNILPQEAKEIKPHPLGLELGTLIQFLHEAKNKSLTSFLKSEFCRVSDDLALLICQSAEVKPNKRSQKVSRAEAESIYNTIQETKFLSPPTNCLSPLNEEAIIKSLYWFYTDVRETILREKQKLISDVESDQTEFEFSGKSDKSQVNNLFTKLEELKDDSKQAILSEAEGFFVTAVTRPPSVYRGNPFQIEVGLFHGKSLPSDELVQVFRYANRVPLQYQASACAMTKSLISAPWKSYGLSQGRGALPVGPVVLILSISSVWVPYTSESKEAVAHYPEIIKELRLALMEAGRRLQRFLNKRKRQADEEKKRSYIEKYLSPIQEALCDILGEKTAQPEKIARDLEHILEEGRAHKKVKLSQKSIT